MARSTYLSSSTSKKRGGEKRSITPMMEQFQRAKKEQPDALLFFRMGDFYELFGEDAKTVSRELGLTLTSRDKGKNATPMAGVPVRSGETYMMKLVRKGYKVAICEQISDPKKSKGIVDRAIVRVVTAGTITEEDVLNARENNFLASLHSEGNRVALAWVDVSTGRFLSSEVAIEDAADEVARIQPAELLCSSDLTERQPGLAAEIRKLVGPAVTERDEWRFERDNGWRSLTEHFHVATLEGFGIERDSGIVPAAGALIEYLQETQRSACEHVRRIELTDPAESLILDRATRSCLELTRTQREGRHEGTLLAAIDATVTPMGGRLIREWVLAPLRRVRPILHRQEGVAEFVAHPFLRDEVREILREVLDIERLAAKVSTGRANARDLVGLAASLAVVDPLAKKMGGVYSSFLAELTLALDPLEDVVGRVSRTLVDSPPLTIREGGLIREGFSEELDSLQRISGDGRSWMARFQKSEVERTSIQGLKIGFNSVFGYFIEVPRGQVSKVPEHYVRKQTIKTAERYITSELKEFEGKVLNAEEKAHDLEYELFTALRDEVATHLGRILDTAQTLAHVDVLAGLAQIAADHRYVAPELTDGETIQIVDGRHPVIERSSEVEAFVPNDSRMNRSDRMIAILTGPNMAGKSTYIRQTALIVLLAQIGSFVPAKEARIGVVDRVFTRVGASDDIGRGASTFMVEMVEVANILNNATNRSLLVLDEVGRGTSTFDGLALAWAIVEYIHERIGARSLFATHYHQLTDLASRFPGVCNMTVAVREWQDEIIFLHKIVEGGTDRSYGLHVARLAGVPAPLLDRAKELLRDLEEDAEHLSPRIASACAPPTDAAGEVEESFQQLDLFPARRSVIETELGKIDPDRMTPIDALMTIREWKERLSRSGSVGLSPGPGESR